MANELTTRAVEENLIIDGVANEHLTGIDDGFLGPQDPPPANEGSDKELPRHPVLPPDEISPIYPRPAHPSVDVNLYATKKTVAQGMMDLALFTANANQLRYVLETGSSSPFYYSSVVLISVSIILQLVSGLVLIFLGRYNLSEAKHAQKSEVLNNWVVVLVFLITAVNVFISAFGIDPVEKIDPVLIVDAALKSMKADRLETHE